MLPAYPLTAEQIEIQNLARDFASREILPARNLYEKETLAGAQLIEKICRSGLVNIRIPEEFGGLGLSLLDTCLIAEEFAFICSGIGALSEASELAITYLLHAGSKEQKKKFLTPLTEEGALAGIAPVNCLGNSIDDKLLAKQQTDKIILDGQCSLVLNAKLAKWFLVACPLIGEAKQEKTQSINKAYFIIPNDIEGLEVLDPIVYIGRRAAQARAVNFKNVCLPLTAKIDDLAFKHVNNILSSSHAAIISSGCLGIARAAFVEAKKYAQERKTFNVPIAKHQVISFMLADMITAIEAARIMIYDTVRSLDAKCNNEKLAMSTQAFALEMAAWVTNDAVQILGGYGYTKDYAVEKLMRDAKVYQSFYGIGNDCHAQLGKMLVALA